MGSQIEFKQVTDYAINKDQPDRQDLPFYEILSRNKNPDNNQHWLQYKATISPETEVLVDANTGLYVVDIEKYRANKVDHMQILHLSLIKEPEYNESDGTVNVQAEVAPITQTNNLFSHTYGGEYGDDLIDINMSLV